MKRSRLLRTVYPGEQVVVTTPDRDLVISVLRTRAAADLALVQVVSDLARSRLMKALGEGWESHGVRVSISKVRGRRVTLSIEAPPEWPIVQ